MLRRFLKNRKGVAALEFALILPGLLLAFFGAIELTRALQVNARTQQMASTAADLVAQSTSISTADANNVFSAVTSILFPYPSGTESIVISSVIDNGNGQGKVAWSNARNTSPRAVNSIMTLPSGIMTTGGSVILAEVSVPYQSPTTLILSTPLNFRSSFFSKPRRVAQIIHT